MTADVEIPGFVDHHAHALAVAAGERAPWTGAGGVRGYHESCAARGISPMDDTGSVAADGLAARLRDGLSAAAALGICELWEAGIKDWSYLDALLELREAGPLPVRVRLLAACGLAQRGMRPRVGDDWCDLVGVKFYADGWLGPRTCAMSAPFIDDDANCGIAFESPTSLARRVEPFAEDGWRIATHAIGDRAIESVITAYERVFGDDCASAAPRIEHAQVLRADLIERMAAAGIVACIQPGFGVQDEASARVAVGDAWPLAYRWGELLDAGVTVVCGSDYPIDELSPMSGLRKLVENPFQPMGVDVALGLMTAASSGTTMLAEDPRDVAPSDLSRIEVRGVAPAGESE